MMSLKSNNKRSTTKRNTAGKVKCYACQKMVSTNSVSINRDGYKLCIGCYHDCCWELRKSAITSLEARQVQELKKQYRESVLHYILGVRAYKRLYKTTLEEAYVALLEREQNISESTYKKDMTCLTTREHMAVMEEVLKSFSLTFSFRGLSQKVDSTNGKESLRHYRRHYLGLRGLHYSHY